MDVYSPLTCIDFTSAAEGDVLVAQRIYMWCDNLYYFAIACLLLCAAVSLGIAATMKLHSCPPQYVFIVFIALPINHHLAKLLFILLFRYKASVNCSDFSIIMLVSNGRRYEMSFMLLQSSKQQPCIFFFSSHLFEFECCAFRARAVWLSTDRELCWIPFLSSCLTSVSWLRCRILREVISVPLPYADDFGWRSPI